MDLAGVGLPMLEAVAEALEGRRLAGTVTAARVAQVGVGSREGADALSDLAVKTGLRGAALATVLRALAAERRRAQALADRVEFVWTGPEAGGMESRDTAVIVRDLFRRAKHRVLVASYAVDDGDKARALVGDLAARHDAEPSLEVSLFLNVQRKHGSEEAEATLLQRFAEHFRDEIWPGRRLPRVYYDPRALSTAPGPRACLHAKCVVADDRWSFVTSANFTEAAQVRNIEAGVVIDDTAFARVVIGQFDGLVHSASVKLLPGTGC